MTESEPAHPPTRAMRLGGGALLAVAAALLMGGCASQAAQYEAQYEPAMFVDSGAPVAAATTEDRSATPTAGAGETIESDWTQRTYVYRGGRDPKTGLARTQL